MPIFPIVGKIFSHPYDWGGTKLIPPTLGFKPEPGVPYAEYWLGVHKKAPAQVTMPDGTTIGLDQLIESDPVKTLGAEVAHRFGNLPFLFKLLDAGEMLSIQVHPNKKQAEEGFAREEAKGIPLTDPKRTYKDNNLKAEFAIVMDDFWLLHGFRQKEDLRNILQTVKEFDSLQSFFEGEKAYEKLYKHVMMDMSDQEANAMLNKLAQRVMPEYAAGRLQKTSPDYWAAKAIRYMEMKPGAYDRGLFSVYFLNLLNLKPGQAIFQDAGILHAYLEGPIIEVMTTSDNVARGGITPKFVDVKELMKLVRFEGVTPKVLEGRPDETGEEFFDAPLDEFVVSKIVPTQSYKHKTRSAEILIGMEGNASIETSGETLPLSKGKSVIVLAETEYEIKGSTSDIVFKTSVPIK